MDLANEQMWGKGRNITLIMVGGETFMSLEGIEKISLWWSELGSYLVYFVFQILIGHLEI